MTNKTVNINFSGATYNIADHGTIVNYVLSGTGTLTGNYSIAATGTLVTGRTHNFQVDCDVELDGNTFQIFGVSISEDNLRREGNIIAVYNGASWDINIQPSSRAANWISTQDLQTDGDLEVITIPISFEANEQCAYRVVIPYSGYILRYFYVVTKAIAGTDAAVLDVEITGSAASGLSTTIPMSSGTGYNGTKTSSSPTVNEFSSSDNIDFLTSKTTAGGKALVSMVIQRI
jgi:hypothetical protein